MIRYIIGRSVHAITVLFVASVAVFLLMHVIPGDPITVMASPLATREDIERLRSRLGLDDPLPVQYARWLGRLAQGDLGESARNGVPVAELLWPRYLNTLRLTAASMVIAVSFGLAIGIIASANHNSLFDTASMVLATGAFAIPPFWLGLILILVFGVRLNLLPTGGGASLAHLVLPAISLGLAATALIARMTRSAMLEVLGRDYIRTARAKGLAERQVLGRHAIRNALIPVVTVIGLQCGVLMAGAFVTEVVFDWPGIGWLMVNGILNRDFPVVQAALLVTSATFIAINLTVDLLYTYLDPRLTRTR